MVIRTYPLGFEQAAGFPTDHSKDADATWEMVVLGASVQVSWKQQQIFTHVSHDKAQKYRGTAHAGLPGTCGGRSLQNGRETGVLSDRVWEQSGSCLHQAFSRAGA